MPIPIKAATLARPTFANYSLDMIGPFKKAQWGYTHILVAIDKFTKWKEYKPIASLTSEKQWNSFKK
jgi:hypothetical protein